MQPITVEEFLAELEAKQKEQDEKAAKAFRVKVEKALKARPNMTKEELEQFLKDREVLPEPAYFMPETPGEVDTINEQRKARIKEIKSLLVQAEVQAAQDAGDAAKQGDISAGRGIDWGKVQRARENARYRVRPEVERKLQDELFWLENQEELVTGEVLEGPFEPIEVPVVLSPEEKEEVRLEDLETNRFTPNGPQS